MDQTSQLILALALMFTMWGMGMTLTIADFKRVFNSPKALALGLVNQLILVPLIAFGLLKFFPSDPKITLAEVTSP